ncbi:hypothetical protein WH47_05278 [Habropoda laboriosa]|uniref:Uncharacterized protein n=1 Tax=Habropoda laboriosa TaxID=597456 RepID=A0A0L7QVR7_9HYME|nr:hypothetical protein WH47_05278 [Habropoda laboriosa]
MFVISFLRIEAYNINKLMFDFTKRGKKEKKDASGKTMRKKKKKISKERIRAYDACKMPFDYYCDDSTESRNVQKTCALS